MYDILKRNYNFDQYKGDVFVDTVSGLETTDHGEHFDINHLVFDEVIV